MLKGSPDLKALIDDELLDMDADGRFAAIWRRHLGEYTDRMPMLPPTEMRSTPVSVRDTS